MLRCVYHTERTVPHGRMLSEHVHDACAERFVRQMLKAYLRTPVFFIVRFLVRGFRIVISNRRIHIRSTVRRLLRVVQFIVR